MAVNRGVIPIHAELIQSLLLLPEDVRVVNFGISPEGQRLLVVVEHEAIPASEEGGQLYGLIPSYRRCEDGQVKLTSLGIDDLAPRSQADEDQCDELFRWSDEVTVRCVGRRGHPGDHHGVDPEAWVKLDRGAGVDDEVPGLSV